MEKWWGMNTKLNSFGENSRVKMEKGKTIGWPGRRVIVARIAGEHNHLHAFLSPTFHNPTSHREWLCSRLTFGRLVVQQEWSWHISLADVITILPPTVNGFVQDSHLVDWLSGRPARVIVAHFASATLHIYVTLRNRKNASIPSCKFNSFQSENSLSGFWLWPVS